MWVRLVVRRYRSTEQAVVTLISGVATAVLVLPTLTDGFHQVSAKGVLVYATLLVVLAVSTVPQGRAALFVSPDGVQVRNPYSRRRIAWREIKGFRIGRHGLLGAVCIIDLTDGTTQHAYAIAVPNRALGKPDSRERGIIDELNVELAAHKQKLAHDDTRRLPRDRL